ncbi:MAG: choice-of-anchor L domain-containing protein [Flavobacteriia bacterium]|nr:choice-of-anchor L domain-containing protein [Flavobacteriia bacterium]
MLIIRTTVLLCFVLMLNNAYSQLVISNQGASASSIVSGFIGTGLTITNPVISCPSNAYGTFSGGTALGVSNGVILTTGLAANVSNPATFFMSTNNGTTCNDAQLTSLDGSAKNDCCILEFDVTPQCTQLTIKFVFGSEEYPSFVNSSFNDAFGFFVSGPNPTGGSYTNKNIAIVTGTTICSIDNVNANTNSGYYVNNTGGTVVPFGGYTTALTSTLAVTPCQIYHFKIAIADASDHIYDSGVFIDFLQCANAMSVSSSATNATCGLANGTATAVVTNGIAPLTYTWSPAPGAGQGTPNVTGLTAGVTYTVSVDDSYACILPQTSSVSIVGTLAPTVTVNSSVICSNSNATVTATPGSAGTYSYAWTVPSGVTNPGNVSSFTTNVQGTYSVIITNTVTSCSSLSASGTVTVNMLPTATISYTGPFCTSNSTAQAVTLTGTNSYTGGAYTSSPSGLSINSSTGAITPSLSAGGTYTVTYTIPATGSCPAVTVTTNVTINVIPTATISYAGPFCTSNSTAQAVTLTGTNSYIGGTYTSSPSGLSINSSTGAVTPSLSTGGTYTVTYTITGSGACPNVVATTSVTINQAATATISYAGPFCTSNSTAQAVTLTGTNSYTGGAYTSLPSGLSINSSTGAITPSLSVGGTYTVTYTIPATGSCPAVTATTNVTIDVLPTAVIDYLDPFCKLIAADQMPTISGTGSYSGGVFSSSPSGLTINSTTGAILPSSSTVGTYTVTYTIAASSSCLAVSVTTSVTISPILIPTITCGTATSNSLIFNWNSVVGATGYSVSYQVNSGSLISVGSIGNVLSYSVTGLSPNDNVTITVLPTGATGTCFDSSNQICQTTDCTPPSALINYSGPYCTSLTTAQSVVLNGQDGVNDMNINWPYTGGIFSSTTGLSINGSNGEIVPSMSTSGTYVVTYTIPASGSCTSVTATTSVVITQMPTVSISYNGPYCNSDITPYSVIMSGTNSYLGGQFSTSPTGLFLNANSGLLTPNLSTSGTYMVTYSTLASGGCPVVQATTSVAVTALPTSNIAYQIPFCLSDNGPEVSALNGSGAYTGGSYSSTPSGLNINTVSGEIIPNLSLVGTYNVLYTTLPGGGCPVTTSTTVVEISALPNATISGSDTICAGLSSLISFVGSPNAMVSYTVNNGAIQTLLLDGSGVGSVQTGILQADVVYTLTGVAYITSPYCSQLLNQTAVVTIENPPVINFTPNITTGCVPLTVSFTNTTQNSNSCNWNFGDGDSEIGCGVVSHTFLSAGCFDISLNVESINGCTASLSVPDLVCVEDKPHAAFDVNPNVILTTEPIVNLNNTSIGATTYNWMFGDGLSSTLISPSHEYNVNEVTGYTITLIAKSTLGCTDTAISSVSVKEELLYFIPNTFTPDGDKFNQTFQPVFSMGIDPYNFNMLIFNRWGEIIFESNDAKIGWDGTYGGKLVQEGVYTWKINFKLKTSDERKMITGHVNVLK